MNRPILQHSIATGSFALCSLLLACLPSHAEPLLAQIKLAKKSADNYYVLEATKTELTVSKNATGGATSQFKISLIEELQFTMPTGWEDALAHRQRKEHEKAAAAFSKFAKDYAKLAAYPDSPPALATYYLLDALRRLGKYKELNKERITALARNVNLSERYQDEMNLFRAWGHIGQKAWKELLLVVNDYELKLSTKGDIPLPRMAPFMKLPANLTAQLAFLRATAHENLGNSTEAPWSTTHGSTPSISAGNRNSPALGWKDLCVSSTPTLRSSSITIFSLKHTPSPFSTTSASRTPFPPSSKSTWKFPRNPKRKLRRFSPSKRSPEGLLYALLSNGDIPNGDIPTRPVEERFGVSCSEPATTFSTPAPCKPACRDPSTRDCRRRDKAWRRLPVRRRESCRHCLRSRRSSPCCCLPDKACGRRAN